MNPLVGSLLWIAFAFLCGALPLSFWMGRVILGVDIRTYGDGNPGAANVWRAGGKWWGLLAILLDAVKGLVPVALANFGAGVSDWTLVAVALAPMLGHAYTPFLGFNGGKALSVTFGVWTGLTLGEGPILLGTLLGCFFLVQSSSTWAALLAMLVFLAHLLLRRAGAATVATWCGNALILFWKHRHDLRELPRPRAWVSRLARWDR